MIPTIAGKFRKTRLLTAICLGMVANMLSSCSILRGSSVDAKAEIIISEARSYTGVPYKWGGTTKVGMDCSGLVMQSFAKAGIQLPRTAEEQFLAGKKIKLEKVKPGDLIFFALSEKKNKLTHVGIVTEKKFSKPARFIHASSSKGVIEADMGSNYFQKGYRKACRVLK